MRIKSPRSQSWLLTAVIALLCGSGIYTLVLNGATANDNISYFVGAPDTTNDLTPWMHLQIGETVYPVAEHPKGMTGIGSVLVVPDPLGIQGQVYKLSVTPAANFSAKSAKSDRVDLWNNNNTDYIGREGQETWEHVRLMFPHGNESYNPTSGDWNWLVEHHNDSNYKPFVNSGILTWEYPELVWGVNTKAKLPDGTEVIKLFMRVWGGDDTHPGKPTIIYQDSPLAFNHWYDMLTHVVWSHDGQKGQVEWWLDGKLLFSQHTATLWQRPDGTIDHVNFEFTNYRLHSDMNSTVYYSQVKLGPSRNSVLF